jgi:hypothetical protein
MDSSPEDSHNDDEFGTAPGADGDSSARAPGSSSKTHVRKDRPCPFCKQIFTSSSLGRHLDFFIRDKKPKLADGVHDVDKIKELRGTITRRHARTSAGHKKEHQHGQPRSESTPVAVEARLEPKTEPTPIAVSDNGIRIPGLNAQHQEHQQTQPYAPIPPMQAEPPRSLGAEIRQGTTLTSDAPPKVQSWTATGVINNLPPRATSARNPRMLLPRPDLQHSAPHARADGADGDENENGRAAELALREVLDSIKRATTRESQEPLFDFDFFRQNFAGVCLRLLEHAVTHDPATSAVPGTLPSTPPTRLQFDEVHAHLLKRLGGQTTLYIPGRESTEKQKYLDHLNNAYRTWESQSPQQQQQVWQEELLRAFAEERDSRRTAGMKAEGLEAQLDTLQAQLDSIRAAQPLWMQSIPLPSPSTIRHRAAVSGSLQMTATAARRLKEGGLDLNDWSYEQLITKWKPVAQTERSRRNWPIPHAMPSAPPEMHNWPPLRSVPSPSQHEPWLPPTRSIWSSALEQEQRAQRQTNAILMPRNGTDGDSQDAHNKEMDQGDVEMQEDEHTAGARGQNGVTVDNYDQEAL